MKGERHTPPRWMDWLIELYCRRDKLEDLQGDLHEYYARNVKKSRFRADLIFLLDVIKFCRLYTIRKPKILGQMTFFNLLGNYFKTSVRSLARNKLFSAINIIGLSISMSIGILMITYINQLLSYDDFHENKEIVFKVYSTYTSVEDGDNIELASNSVFMADKLKEDYPGIADVLIMQGWATKDFTYDEKTLQLEGKFASEQFFDFFSFKLLSGDPKTALKEPYSVVLTETAAEKYFLDEDPVGRIFQSGEDTYTITGLMEDPPSNNHLGTFEMLESFSTQRSKQKDNKGFGSWGNLWSYHVYIMMDEVTDASTAQGYLDQISLTKNAEVERYDINYHLIQLDDLVPGNGESNNIGPYINWGDIYKLIALTVIIIASACFNYTNLSIARSLRRAKEVGIRKVVGASYQQVFIQFLFEATLISLIALVIAYGMYLLIKPEFIRQVIDSEGVALDFRLQHVPLYLLFTIGIGLFAGFVPALILSRLKAISILKDATKLKLFKGLTMRKVLIVFQFSISMALIISATISYRQYLFSVHYDLGFNTDNVLNIDLHDTNVDVELLRTEFEKIPEVQNISISSMLPATQTMHMTEIVYKEDSLSVFYNKVDMNYLDIHEIAFAAGGTFPLKKSIGDSSGYIVIDEVLCEKLGFQNPADALGAVIDYSGSNYTLEVSGVMKDYQYTDLQNELGATAFIQRFEDRVYYMNLLINTSDIIGLMDKLEGAWRTVDPVHSFKAEFYEVQVQESYADYKTMFRLFTFLALIAISICSLGLLGIVVFTTETRIKEISVRKVLGATDKNLIYLLSRSFIAMLLVSALIAIPFSYYLFDEYVLVDFRERISIGVMELLPGVAIIVLIAFITISWQTLKAAKTNPADMLRDE